MGWLKKLLAVPTTKFRMNNQYIADFGPGCWPAMIPARLKQPYEKQAFLFKHAGCYVIIDFRRKQGVKRPFYPDPILADAYSQRKIIKMIAKLEKEGWTITA